MFNGLAPYTAESLLIYSLRTLIAKKLFQVQMRNGDTRKNEHLGGSSKPGECGIQT
ncbi:hypothetical protein Pmar_PMAR005341 [Perkinsus marinus ATCC 50983]|uniref:Uncharacterized protein n=1 Tax=Perkinsus marinus (strain ATCC 50983 / TXsc) TaxID=423536 RepID=C5KBA4_PERM5|nr:hypothetical protein Pmar_PMAR005341 [Perkinsus marinus ATCC 50983]EER18430.1 hypothetical protein Pmar_PMAR005341 [Perkinsus marinus ATCC 50983]|eukprot:XP_002786634.1 hypothetical protein Pmar_PMAR005341 [Perkinsus marinus ATCC 50983]